MSTHYITRLFETLTFFFFCSPVLELKSSYSFKYQPDMPEFLLHVEFRHDPATVPPTCHNGDDTTRC